MLRINPLPGQAGTIAEEVECLCRANGVTYSVAPNSERYYICLVVTGKRHNRIWRWHKFYNRKLCNQCIKWDIIVYGNNICGDGGTSPAFPVSITALPSPAGNISGPSTVCQGDTGKVYSVPPIYGASGYSWSLPLGAYSVSGSGSNTITVDFSISAVSGNITVYGSNSCGNGRFLLISR